MPETLCAYQERGIASILTGLDAARTHLPTILVMGLPGTGKRTIAQNVADRLGIPFFEIRLDSAAIDVNLLLFGEPNTDVQLRSSSPTGIADLASTDSMLVYLSHLEGLDSTLIQRLANMLATRRYIDGSGKTRKLGEETWIVSGLTVGVPAKITPTHWLTSRFDFQFNLTSPMSDSDFQTVAENCAKSCSGKGLASDIGSLLLSMSPQDNFHAVRRWISAACAVFPEPVLNAEAVREASIEDLSWLLRKVEYRGKRLEMRHVRKWLGQMSVDVAPIAVQLIRQLADRYFMTAEEYFYGLSVLVQQAGISSSNNVCFCKWQPLGKSAAHISHDLKNQGRWKVLDDIDFSLPEESWPNSQLKNPVFVLADDFVGTGGTLSKLMQRREEAPVLRLAELYPQARFVVLLLVAYEQSASAAIRALSARLGSRVSVYIYRTLTEADQCFTSTSSIIPVSLQPELKRLCITSRAKYFKSLPIRFLYGYEQTGAIFAFFNSVPNNSLPVLWHDQADWFPLLPASRTLS